MYNINTRKDSCWNLIIIMSLCIVDSIIRISLILTCFQNFIWDGKTSKISQKNINTIYRQWGQFSTKVESLKLAWIKRLTNPTPANWKVLPKYYFTFSNLDTYFSTNHKPINTTVIPNVYNGIHSLYMKCVKQEPKIIKDISNQILWLNKYININKNLLEKKGTRSHTYT